MTKNLKTLIKISQFELDKKRRELGEITSRQDGFYKQIKDIDGIVESEQKAAITNEKIREFLSSFIFASKEKQKNLREEAKKLEPEIQKKTSEISEAFTEVKKYETVLENKLEQEAYEENKKNQLEIDEVAMQKFSENY